ncbi:MAG: DUF1549 and DUF1553 domain-containing protein [Planctomycetales bacterium]|nr:DUF1549 and DUF1553 domain-containing protein [Planctomycetales bacterium]
MLLHRVRLVLALTCCAVVLGAKLAAATAADVPLDFTNDIVPLLSKQGCNSGSCHGKAIGQNGFKLSLFGFDPAFDYAALMHEGRGRRISAAAPDDSLLLLKSSGGMAHGGGVRFGTDSAPYKLLRQWIEQGAPWGAENAPRAVRLEVSPAEQMVSGKGEFPLKVVAHYSDSSTRDVTATARYDSQQPMLLEVLATGLVMTSGQVGEGYVMVRYGDLVAASRFTQPFGPELPVDAYASFQPKTFIDELVLAKWKKIHLAPSPACSDDEFLRRVCLDVMGTLPTPQEVRDFLADAAPDKRDRLVDRMLERPEYADYWAQRFAELLRVKVGDSSFKDHTVKFHGWIRQSLAANKPYDQFVRQIITVTGKRADHPQMDWYRQAITNQVRVEDTAQAFLGLRVSCASCHNHPFENISQSDYWRFAAFFARVGSVTYGSVDEIKLDENGMVKHPRSEQPLKPRGFGAAYGTPVIEYVKGEDPRLKLADWMAAPDNPYFARAICNRLVGHYLDVGLIDPVDDMRATNPASNPELLDRLAKDFVEHKFDLKHLAKLIMTSRVYSLSTNPTDANKLDTRNYARHYPRRLSPHVLMDAIAGVTGVPTKFVDYPEIKKAVLLPNEKGRSDFLDMFGRSSRDTPCECETSLSPNLSQVLYLLHSDELQRKLADKDGICVQLAKSGKSSGEIADELFLRTFSRLPRPEERAETESLLDTAKDKQSVIEDLLWTLMNSKEFLFSR